MFKPLDLHIFGVRCGRCFATAPMSSAECLRVLGVNSGSTDDHIKQAFRKLAKTHHPDLGGNADRFVKIQQAYEKLMDPTFRKGPGNSSAYSEASSSSNGAYWRAWDTSSTWWGGGSTSYSTERDFDAEFEEQWKRYTKNTRNGKGRKFKAKSDSESAYDEQEEDGLPKNNREERYKSARGDKESFSRRGRKSKKTQPDSGDLPEKLQLESCHKSLSSICGEYIRTANFNGRISFSATGDKPRFVFWSNKNKDWKISEFLKDDGNCLAFNSKINPSIDCPFILGDESRWMVWSHRARRYVASKLQAKDVAEDYSSWSVEKLRETLSGMGLGEKAQQCCEKQELVDLMKQFSYLRSRTTKKDRKRMPADDPIPEGSFRLCSRQRHDGVIQAPPVLSDACNTGKNRVDSFMGKLEDIEPWLERHGDRRRLYGVFDSERTYCFSLIWKSNKHWARAGAHDW